MEKPVTLVAAKPRVNDDLVEELERLLEQAKSGEVRSALIVYHTNELDVLASTSWRAESLTDKMMLLGAVVIAQRGIEDVISENHEPKDV